MAEQVPRAQVGRQGIRLLVLAGVVALLGSGLVSAERADPTTADRDLALGIRQLQDGEFEEAVFTLDAVVRSHHGRPDRRIDLVQAYLHLGAAFAGLEHDAAARGKFREALKLDPELRLGPEQFSPRVGELFEEERLARTAATKNRAAKRFLLAGAAAAATAVAVTGATKEAQLPENRSPSLAIGLSPEGTAILDVTRVTFTATAADPDGDPVTFEWDLGNGERATGATASTVFRSDGTFTVTLRGSDGKGGVGTTTRSVIARTLTGTWSPQQEPYTCTQSGAAFACVKVAGLGIVAVSGTLSHPRRLALTLVTSIGSRHPCEGDVKSDANLLVCISFATQHRFIISRR